jgi:hypothetical protein
VGFWAGRRRKGRRASIFSSPACNFSIEQWPVSRLLKGEVAAKDVASRLVKPGFAGEDKTQGVADRAIGPVRHA